MVCPLLERQRYMCRQLPQSFNYGDTNTPAASPGAPEVKPRDFSVWVTPRTSFGLEALIRYDELKPNKDLDQEQFDNYAPAKPDNKKYALHTLLNF